MTDQEAKTKPLNELVDFLVDLYQDCDCCCRCKVSNGFDERDRAALYNCKKSGRYDKCTERIAYERVMEACEKQIPKKPKKNWATMFYCDCCGTFVVSKELYCSNCGQALDWSREDEQKN